MKIMKRIFNRWIANVKSRENIGVMICVALLGGVTFCVFAPLELYFTNINEYSFDIYVIAPVIIKMLLVFLTIFLLIFFLISFFSQKTISSMITLLFSLFLSLYVQGNYVGCDYGVLDGSEILWDTYVGYFWASIAVWCISIVLFQVLLVKLKSAKIFKIIRYACVFIVLIQIVTLIIISIPNGFNKKQFISMKCGDMFEVSENKNIVVLVLDSFESSVFSELIEEPEIRDVFKDFTYFQDAVGMYATTKASIPHIITGEKYLNQQDFDDYITDSYEQSKLFSYFRENNYEYDIYSQPGMIPKIVDVGISNAMKETEAVESETELGKMLYQLVAYKYFPHQLKEKFWLDTSEFEKLIPSENYRVSRQLLTWDKLIEEGVTLDNKNNCFKFYHLKGNHVPYDFNEELEPLAKGEKITEHEVACGNMKFLKELLRQFKDKGVYDNSAIIIMADHGNKIYHSNPLLLAKEFGVRQQEMFVSKAPISYEDIYPTLEYFAGMTPSKPTIFDIKENQVRERYFYWYVWNDASLWGKEFLPMMTEYSVKDTADNTWEYVPTGKLYSEGVTEERERYQIEDGDIIYFNNDDKYNSFVLAGFTPIGKNDQGKEYAWSIGNRSYMNFTCEDTGSNINMVFKGMPISEGQEIIYYLNDNRAGSLNNISNSFELELPSKYLQSGDNVLVLEYPNAVSPKELGLNEDANRYAFSVNSIQIEVME